MPKIKHYESVSVVVTVYKDGRGNAKVEIFDFLEENLICSFFVPDTALMLRNNNYSVGFIDEGILKSRAKHDFKITFDHYTYMGKLA